MSEQVHTTLRRYAGIPGLHYEPTWLPVQTATWLLTETDKQPWSTELVRRVQHYGYRYNYRERQVSKSDYLGPLPQVLDLAAQTLVEHGHFATKPDQVIVNEYLPGQGIAPHTDCTTCFGDTIATLSLGDCYPLEFHHRGTDTHKSLYLAIGSLLVLSGPARYEWTHAIERRKTDGTEKPTLRGRRVSITFRNVIVT